MPINLESVAKTLGAVAQVANAFGIPVAVGVAVTVARRHFTAEGRRSRIARTIVSLGDPELLRGAGDDVLLLQAIEEERRALALAAVAGFMAYAGERAVILAFVRDRNGQYTFDEVRAARRLLRW